MPSLASNAGSTARAHPSRTRIGYPLTHRSPPARAGADGGPLGHPGPRKPANRSPPTRPIRVHNQPTPEIPPGGFSVSIRGIRAGRPGHGGTRHQESSRGASSHGRVLHPGVGWQTVGPLAGHPPSAPARAGGLLLVSAEIGPHGASLGERGHWASRGGFYQGECGHRASRRASLGERERRGARGLLVRIAEGLPGC